MKFFAFLTSLSLVILEMNAAKKMLHPSINICRRNDPELSKCFRENFRKMLPLAEKGVPEMNLIALEPVLVDNMRIDFQRTSAVQLIVDLYDLQVFGLSKLNINHLTVEPTADDGMYMYFDISVPRLQIVSKYKAKGKLMLMEIDSDGDFDGEFSKLDMKSRWNTTSYMKKGKRHLKWTTTVDELSYRDIDIHLQKLFVNQPELDDNVNRAINENAVLLYAELQPVILQTVRSLSVNAVNNIYDLFPFDVLFPVD